MGANIRRAGKAYFWNMEPAKKKVFRIYSSFEEQAADEALMASKRTMQQRLRDTVDLISRVYGVPKGSRMKRIIKFY